MLPPLPETHVRVLRRFVAGEVSTSAELYEEFDNDKIRTREVVNTLRRRGLIEITAHKRTSTYMVTQKGRDACFNWLAPVAKPTAKVVRSGTNPFDWRNFKGTGHG